jgi:hypothetical protein
MTQNFLNMPVIRLSGEATALARQATFDKPVSGMRHSKSLDGKSQERLITWFSEAGEILLINGVLAPISLRLSLRESDGNIDITSIFVDSKIGTAWKTVQFYQIIRLNPRLFHIYFTGFVEK